MALFVKLFEGLQPTFFANGGDRGKTNTPEQSVCEELGVLNYCGV
jgi:hypothetical protein